MRKILLALLVAPLVLATHVVITRTRPRLAAAWVLTIVGLLTLSVGLAALGLFLELSRQTR